jgi:hypothetical protein
MGLQIPGELMSLLGTLGYTWPEGDETKLFELGQAWLAFPDRLTAALEDAQYSAKRVWSGNHDTAIDSFHDS